MGLAIAGGVESMTRAPFVIGKADRAYGRGQQLEDTTMGWRFVNPALDKASGTESMPQTGDNVAADHGVDRADQDALSLRSQQRAAAAQASGFFAEEITPVTLPGARRGQTDVVDLDAHPRPGTTAEPHAGLQPLFAGDRTSKL